MKLKKDLFFDGASDWEDLGGGVSRQFVGYNSQQMMVKVKFEKGAIGAMHHHFHSQVTYVAGGQFEVTVDGQTKVLKDGDGFFCPAQYGAWCKMSRSGPIDRCIFTSKGGFFEMI